MIVGKKTGTLELDKEVLLIIEKVFSNGAHLLRP